MHDTVPVSDIAPSKSNPRKTFDESTLAELTESVRKHGVLQPLLLRPSTNGTPFELVAGHRRLRAAKAAGLESVPGYVRELDDKEVLEIQVVENLQRDDLDPLEEAQGYVRLTKEFGYGVDELATKVGKSKAYVYSRMKLADLPKKARKLFDAGKLTPSTALLVARMPVAALAEKAAAEIAKGRRWGSGEPMSYREAQEWIRNEFMVALKTAPFRTNDADLVPSAGACTGCPKRSGNQPDLFGDVSADVCTDLKCFRKKSDAAFRSKVKAAPEGWRAASAAEKKKFISHGRVASWQLHGAGLIELGEKCELDSRRRTWRSLLKGVVPAGILLQDPESGRAVELVKDSEAKKALRGAHPWARAKPAQAKPRESSAAKRAKREAAIKRETQRLATEALVAFAETSIHAEASAEIWRPLAIAQIQAVWHDTAKAVAGRRGLLEATSSGKQRARGPDVTQVLEKWASGASGPELVGLVVELVAVRVADDYGSDTAWKGLCKAAGVDLVKAKRDAGKLVPAAAPKRKKPKARKGAAS